MLGQADRLHARVRERAVSDSRQRFGQRDVLDIGAVFKRLITDCRHALGNRHVVQIRLTVEPGIGNGGDCIALDLGRDVAVIIIDCNCRADRRFC